MDRFDATSTLYCWSCAESASTVRVFCEKLQYFDKMLNQRLTQTLLPDIYFEVFVVFFPMSNSHKVVARLEV